MQVWQLVAELEQLVQLGSQAVQTFDVPPVENEVELHPVQEPSERMLLTWQVWQAVALVQVRQVGGQVPQATVAPAQKVAPVQAEQAWPVKPNPVLQVVQVDPSLQVAHPSGQVEQAVDTEV